MVDQFLSTISSVVALGEFLPGAAGDLDTHSEPNSPLPKSVRLAQQAQRAEREWQAAIAAVRQLLKQTAAAAQTRQGVLLSGPFPVLDAPALTARLASWTFVPQPLEKLSLAFSQLMPAEGKTVVDAPAARLLPLIEGDPLTAERFCLLLTEQFNLVLVLGKDANQELHFQFSFTPEVVRAVWELLRSRIQLIQPQQLDRLSPLVETFTRPVPDHRWVSQFTRLMLSALPDPLPAPHPHHIDRVWPSDPPHPPPKPCATDAYRPSGDIELLKAMAHEISTPLTTIRTLTRSLLRRPDLDDKAIQRLRQIDRECTQQIDRFSLIFKAVELEAAAHSTPRSPLTATPLAELFEASIPQWQQAATRRGLALAVEVPPLLPMVASDPAMLQQVLTGLVELFTHSVPTGSHIDLQVLLAGDQLKLQFQAQSQTDQPPTCTAPPLQSLGHLLMFQPETGGLSLNLEATKSLFQALGAKLTVRDRAQQGSTWTVFLPVETANYPIV